MTLLFPFNSVLRQDCFLGCLGCLIFQRESSKAAPWNDLCFFSFARPLPLTGAGWEEVGPGQVLSSSAGSQRSGQETPHSFLYFSCSLLQQGQCRPRKTGLEAAWTWGYLWTRGGQGLFISNAKCNAVDGVCYLIWLSFASLWAMHISLWQGSHCPCDAFLGGSNAFPL